VPLAATGLCIPSLNLNPHSSVLQMVVVILFLLCFYFFYFHVFLSSVGQG
jgi:hypothetical protein